MAKEKKERNMAYRKLRKADIVYRIYIDLVNGLTKYEIMHKLNTDAYPDATSDYGDSQKYKLIDDAFKMAKEECSEKLEQQREMMYNRLLGVYNDSMTAGDRQNALKSLDQLSKLIGLYDTKQKVELSGNLTNEVTISFGFDNEK